MKLLTKEIIDTIPELYSQEQKGEEAIAYVKFFCPWNNWTWYATEFDKKDTFFGLVIGLDTELGYFNLKELSEATGPLGLKIERDLYFTPKTIAELRKIHK